MGIAKNMLKVSSLILGMVLLLNFSTQAQSGWAQNKGDFYIKLYTLYGASDNYYTLGGDEISTAKFSQSVAGFYGEYGLTDRLTLITHGPLVKRNTFETTDAVVGIGDLPIGAKYQLLSGKVPVSVGLVVDIPLAKANNFAQNEANQFDRINLPTGDGEWNYRFNLAGSHSFHPIPIYISAFGTFNLRTAYEGVSFSDQLIFGVETGVNLGNKWMLNASVKTQSSLGDVKSVDFVRGEGTEFTAINFNASYKVNQQWGITVGSLFYSDLLVARANLYDANVYTAGLFYQIKK